MNTRMIKTNDLPEGIEEELETPKEPEQELETPKEPEHELEAPKEPEQEPEQEEPELLSITLGDADADDIDEAEVESGLGDKGKRLVKKLREIAAEELKKNREANARLALMEANGKPKAQELKKPTFADCNYDEAEFAKQLLEYETAKRRADEAVAKEQKRRQDAEDAYNEQVRVYSDRKKALPVPDFDMVEDVVAKTLSKEQQAILIRNAAEPEKFVYALGKSKKHLDELAAITDLDRFAFKLAKLEGQITVKKKSAPPVESKLNGGSSPTVAGEALKSQLEAAEKDAERTGDRTRVVAIKRQMRAAQQ